MITLIMGPMFSGKTSMLLHMLERSVLAKKRTLLVRPPSDTRAFLSHTQQDVSWLQTARMFLSIENNKYHNFAKNYDVIGIDEGQFQRDLKYFCQNNVEKTIIISALHATSECEMFAPISEIIPYCENIIKLNAICTRCGSEFGNYTYYLKGNKTEKIVVGDGNDYTVLCRECYYKE